ncbi:MAG: EscU/YscU/HrcU family type III secretion system export apparatus switch protein [Geminicoccaceae bacterium]
MSRRQVAVALGHDRSSPAPPRVLAAGVGDVAERILQVAREHGVPVREDSSLARSLAEVEVGAHVPPELWTAVATVLAFLYRYETQQAGCRGR